MTLDLERNAVKSLKYADDASLLVPETTDASLDKEFLLSQKWAADNNLILDMSKTKEIVFVQPNQRNYIPPSAQMSGIERVSWARVPGVVIQSILSPDKHTPNIHFWLPINSYICS